MGTWPFLAAVASGALRALAQLGSIAREPEQSKTQAALLMAVNRRYNGPTVSSHCAPVVRPKGHTSDHA